MRNIFKGFPLFQVENPEKKLRKKKAKIVTHDHLINCVNFNLMGGPHWILLNKIETELRTKKNKGSNLINPTETKILINSKDKNYNW